MIRYIFLLLFVSLIAACTLGPTDAATLGYEQGVNGEPYRRIRGDNADLHREGWQAGNKRYCSTVSYSALARAQKPLPDGICAYTSAQRREYCGAVDYAALGRADGQLPLACSPSSGQRQSFEGARSDTYCTAAYGKRDTVDAFDRLWSYGDCAADSSRRDCERAHISTARTYCRANRSYLAGMDRSFTSAQSEALRSAARSLAELSALTAPTTDQSQARERLSYYLSWAPECELDGFEVDC